MATTKESVNYKLLNISYKEVMWINLWPWKEQGKYILFREKNPKTFMIKGKSTENFNTKKGRFWVWMKILPKRVKEKKNQWWKISKMCLSVLLQFNGFSYQSQNHSQFASLHWFRKIKFFKKNNLIHQSRNPLKLWVNFIIIQQLSKMWRSWNSIKITYSI